MMLDHTTKGIPPYACVDHQAIARMGWNLLREDLDLPLCVLHQEALDNNLAWMQALINDQGALFAPHGKTTMSPELFRQQIQAGAWAITLATSHQVRVARAFGIQRIFYANQVVGKPFMNYILHESLTDPAFEFIFLVDDIRNVQMIEEAARAAGLGKRLPVLVELGFPGGRCGCRTPEQALKLAARVSRSPSLELRGIEGFEGYIHAHSDQVQETKIRVFLQDMLQLMHDCDAAGYFADGLTLFSVGGSAFYDLVFDESSKARLPENCKVLTRSGCYLTQDAGMYKHHFQRIMARSPDIGLRAHGLVDALEVWGYVLSRPESGKLIVNVGKRDISPDDLPVAHSYVSFEGAPAAVPIPLSEHVVVDLNDQHCHIQCPENSPVKVGDAIILGASHPCLTFDKWRHLFLRNDAYDIVGSLSTWF